MRPSPPIDGRRTCARPGRGARVRRGRAAGGRPAAQGSRPAARVVAALREAPLQPARHLLSLHARRRRRSRPPLFSCALLLAAAGVVVGSAALSKPAGSRRAPVPHRPASCDDGRNRVPVGDAPAPRGAGRDDGARIWQAARNTPARGVPPQDPATHRSISAEPPLVRHGRARALGASDTRAATPRRAVRPGDASSSSLTTIGIALLYPDVALHRGRRGRDDAGDSGSGSAVAEGARPAAADAHRSAHPVLSRRVPRAGSGARRTAPSARSPASRRPCSSNGRTRAGRSLRTVVTASGVQLVAGFGFAAWLLFARAQLGDEGGGALLLAYWALNIPLLGQEIAQIAWQYPTQRNLALRLLEPLGALEEDEPAAGRHGFGRLAMPRDGVRIELARGDRSSRRAHDPRRRHRSSSNLARTSRSSDLLAPANPRSWACCSDGIAPPPATVLVDGTPLDGARLDALRQQTAWVDPAVQLWNRSLIENLEFGSSERTRPRRAHRSSRPSWRHRAASRRPADDARRGRDAGVGRRGTARALRAGPRPSRRAPGHSRRAVPRARAQQTSVVASPRARAVVARHARVRHP